MPVHTATGRNMISSMPRRIGRRHNVVFQVAQIDVVAAQVDLLVVGMFEQNGIDPARGGASQVDHALHGTLTRLRAGGIFKGHIGETLMLSTPPLPMQAASVMLIGMGPAVESCLDALGELTELAMRTALRMEAHSAACLLAWSECVLPAENVEASAAAMMHGALAAIEAQQSGQSALRLQWTFDIRNGHARRTTAGLRRALRSK